MGAPVVAATGAGFDVLLLAHVACVLLGLLSVVVATVQAARLRAAPEGPPPAVARYYTAGGPGVGRALYGVPVFGFALLATSGGSDRLGQGWVLTGLALWAVAAGLAEGVLWPAEGRIRGALSAEGAAGPADAAAAWWCSLAVVALLVAGTVVMVTQP